MSTLLLVGASAAIVDAAESAPSHHPPTIAQGNERPVSYDLSFPDKPTVNGATAYRAKLHAMHVLHVLHSKHSSHVSQVTAAHTNAVAHADHINHVLQDSQHPVKVHTSSAEQSSDNTDVTVPSSVHSSGHVSTSPSGHKSRYNGSSASGYGLSSAETQAMQYIMQHESGGDPYAVNPSSGAYGLFQFLPSTPGAPPPGASVATQVAAATAYANARYGGWVNAAAFWAAHSWW